MDHHGIDGNAVAAELAGFVLAVGDGEFSVGYHVAAVIFYFAGQRAGRGLEADDA